MNWEAVLWVSGRVIEEHSLLIIDFGPNSTLTAKGDRNIEPLQLAWPISAAEDFSLTIFLRTLDNQQVKMP